MTWAFFVTGTDTGVGKTVVSAALLRAANGRGMTTAAVKPVASGSEMTPEGLRNEDALLLSQACSEPMSYANVNPVALAPAIAPHLAARDAGVSLDARQLADHCARIVASGTDLVVIEGAGGWRVPLNEREFFSDIAINLKIAVILVVDIKLGCLNHALLSAEAIRHDGLLLAGWVANCSSGPDPRHGDMVTSLRGRLGCPQLADIPRGPAVVDECIAFAAEHIDLSLLL